MVVVKTEVDPSSLRPSAAPVHVKDAAKATLDVRLHAMAKGRQKNTSPNENAPVQTVVQGGTSALEKTKGEYLSRIPFPGDALLSLRTSKRNAAQSSNTTSKKSKKGKTTGNQADSIAEAKQEAANMRRALITTNRRDPEVMAQRDTKLLFAPVILKASQLFEASSDASGTYKICVDCGTMRSPVWQKASSTASRNQDKEDQVPGYICLRCYRQASRRNTVVVAPCESADQVSNSSTPTIKLPAGMPGNTQVTARAAIRSGPTSLTIKSSGHSASATPSRRSSSSNVSKTEDSSNTPLPQLKLSIPSGSTPSSVINTPNGEGSNVDVDAALLTKKLKKQAKLLAKLEKKQAKKLRKLAKLEKKRREAEMMANNNTNPDLKVGTVAQEESTSLKLVLPKAPMINDVNIKSEPRRKDQIAQHSPIAEPLVQAKPKVEQSTRKARTTLPKISGKRRKELIEKGNICPVCKAVYEDDDPTPFVFCDSCEKWLHAACSKADLSKLNASDAKFIGPCCSMR